jgi:hypothetical protein
MVAAVVVDGSTAGPMAAEAHGSIAGKPLFEFLSHGSDPRYPVHQVTISAVKILD